MKTTEEGYINKNNQKNLGYRGVSETQENLQTLCSKCNLGKSNLI